MRDSQEGAFSDGTGTKSADSTGGGTATPTASSRVPLATDKAAAQAMLNELVRNAERQKAGLVDPMEDQRKRPLAEHLEDFTRYLKNKGVTPKQVQTATMQFQRMIDSNK